MRPLASEVCFQRVMSFAFYSAEPYVFHTQPQCMTQDIKKGSTCVSLLHQTRSQHRIDFKVFQYCCQYNIWVWYQNNVFYTLLCWVYPNLIWSLLVTWMMFWVNLEVVVSLLKPAAHLVLSENMKQNICPDICWSVTSQVYKLTNKVRPTQEQHRWMIWLHDMSLLFFSYSPTCHQAFITRTQNWYCTAWHRFGTKILLDPSCTVWHAVNLQDCWYHTVCTGLKPNHTTNIPLDDKHPTWQGPSNLP